MIPCEERTNALRNSADWEESKFAISDVVVVAIADKNLLQFSAAANHPIV